MPRSCPGLDWGRCSQRTGLRSPALQEAGAGSGCGDSGRAGSGHRGGGAAPNPYAGRKSHSIVRCCSHCRFRWLCGHSSSSSARHRHWSAGGILGGTLVISCSAEEAAGLWGVWALELHTPVPVPPALLLRSLYFLCVTEKLPALGYGDSDTREREDTSTHHRRAGASPAEDNNSKF